MVSIVVPTYNEAGNIEPLLLEVAEALRSIDYEVVFVDDSTDDTPQVIERMGQRGYPLQLMHRSQERGLATAVLRGFELARGAYIAVMDADLQHPPGALRGMYCAMRAGADLCVPSRFIPGGGDGGLRGIRKLVSAVARWMGKLMIYNLRSISDPTGGLFMFRRSLLTGAQLRPVGWKILVEVMALCEYHRVIEIPYRFRPRNQGESKLSFKVTLEYIKQLFELLPRMRRNRPLAVEVWSPSELETQLAALEGGKA